jgi:glucokinase
MLILAGDIGGTKTNIGLFDASRPSSDGRDAPDLVKRSTYASREHASAFDVIERFLTEVNGRYSSKDVGAVCLGVAGAVTDGRAQSPNLPWTVDAREVAERLGLRDVTVINDLVATALGIPALREDEFHILRAGDAGAQPRTMMGVVLAAGTGLGIALLVPRGGEWSPMASEGGHAGFAPGTDEEIGLLRFLMRRYGEDVSVERAVSGPGLLETYRYLLELGRLQPDPTVREALEHHASDATRLISENGLSGRCTVCASALDLFVRMYGSAAGDVALTTFARGGVFLGGGIAPKILPKLSDGAFTEAFLAKGRFRSFLERVPVRVILNQETAMLGAARRAVRD